MKTATIREFRNHYSRVLKWVAGGEEVEITRHGTVVAKVVPAATPPAKVDWTRSAALNRPAWSKALSNRERDAILAESQGS
ncbi:MAG: Antitoxin [Verrucomicrobia bacterium]|nr:Antitoxin [Verrucomicrobiota bacterium]